MSTARPFLTLLGSVPKRELLSDSITQRGISAGFRSGSTLLSNPSSGYAQSGGVRPRELRALNISPEQMSYVTMRTGQRLIKYGRSLVPFSILPEGTKLYHLMDNAPGEAYRRRAGSLPVRPAYLGGDTFSHIKTREKVMESRC
jgi:hypothetical protein